jgi:hypothetical protein
MTNDNQSDQEFRDDLVDRLTGTQGQVATLRTQADAAEARGEHREAIRLKAEWLRLLTPK